MATDNFFCPECSGQTIHEDEPGTLYCPECGFAESAEIAVVMMIPQLGSDVIKSENDRFVTPRGKQFASYDEAAKHYLLGDQ